MTVIKIIVVGVICCVAGLVTGLLIAGCQPKPKPEIRIVEKEKPVIKYIVIPTTCVEFEKCFSQPIIVTGKMNGMIFSVLASDGCKETGEDFKLNIVNKIIEQRNIIQLQYIHMISFNGKFGMDMGANISYYRRLLIFKTWSFGIGAGITATNHSAGINAGAMIQF